MINLGSVVAAKLCPGLHFYCLNQAERSYQILDKLGYLKKPMGEPIAQLGATAGAAAQRQEGRRGVGRLQGRRHVARRLRRKELDLAEFEMPGLMSARKEFGGRSRSRASASRARP